MYCFKATPTNYLQAQARKKELIQLACILHKVTSNCIHTLSINLGKSIFAGKEGKNKVANFIGKFLARQNVHENLLRDIFFRDWLLCSPTVRFLGSPKEGRKKQEQ